MSTTVTNEESGILPAVARLRELLHTDDPEATRPAEASEIARLLDHIEEVTRDRVKARGQGHPPMYVTVPLGDPEAIFDKVMSSVRYESM